MTYEPVWGAIIAWYLFLAGLGAGSFITAAFLKWKYPDAHGMRRIAFLIAPIVVAIGLVLLMVDAEAGIRNPLRFALLLTNFGSVMTWGVIFLAGFMVLSLAALLLDFLKKEVPTWLSVSGVVFSLCVAAYTGVLLGVANTFPLWNNALLPILFMVSALSAGAVAVLIVSIFIYPHEFDEVSTLKNVHIAFPLIEVALLAFLLFITSFNSSAGWNSVMNLLVGSYALPFWIGLVVVGLLIPIALEIRLLFFSTKEFEESSKAHYLSAGANAGVLVGGFLLRYLIVVAAVPLVIIP